MPHIIKERHLDDICAQCKKPHGNSIVLKRHYHTVYEIITCQHCSYEIVRILPEIQFTDRLKPKEKKD